MRGNEGLSVAGDGLVDLLCEHEGKLLLQGSRARSRRERVRSSRCEWRGRVSLALYVHSPAIHALGCGMQGLPETRVCRKFRGIITTSCTENMAE